ncbi:MAG: DUF3466 family protein [Candidatus Omnitrophica bacterium]|nr:DUF3466 family protein [Candidatus Omnitrophota bacterium]
MKFNTQDRAIDLNNKDQLLFAKKREGERLPSHWYVGEPDGSTRELRFPVPKDISIKAFNDREEFLASDLNGGFVIFSSTGERLFEATPTHRGKSFRPLQLTNSRLVLGKVIGFTFFLPAIFDCGDSDFRVYGNPFCWRHAMMFSNGINDRGEMVGSAEYWSTYQVLTHNHRPVIPFLFDGKGFFSLDEVMVGEGWSKWYGSIENSEWVIHRALDINDEGVILAEAEKKDGSYEGYVFLVPNTE